MSLFKKIFPRLFLLSFFALPILGCNERRYVTVMLEEGDYTCNISKLTKLSGSDFTFSIVPKDGKSFEKCNYSNYEYSPYVGSEAFSLNLKDVKYSMILTLDFVNSTIINYLDGESLIYSKTIKSPNLFPNADLFNENLRKDSYKLVGYKIDDTDEYVSIGSRVYNSEESYLKCDYVMEESKDSFEYVIEYKTVRLTNYKLSNTILCIPDYIDGYRVTSIDANFAINKNFEKLILPSYLKTIKNGAFSNCQIDELVLFDQLEIVSDNSFVGSLIKSMRINASKKPVFCRNYFGTFPNKIDSLINIKNDKKILLYSGSSTRFGYDSSLLQEEFKDYKVLNLGVYAYSKSRPQLDIIKNFIKKDDVLIISPEFDTIETQINLNRELDDGFYNLIESNYDLIRYLDITKYTNVFDAFAKYQETRKYLPEYDYTESPTHYDEDGNYSSSLVYNRFWDYSLFRKNNTEGISFGIRRAFYNKKYFLDSYINHFNEAMRELEDIGVDIVCTYSPRMNISISEDSTPETIEELGVFLENNIALFFLDSIKESLLDPLYFYGTDNHLSTEGTIIRTKKIINNLKEHFGRNDR